MIPPFLKKNLSKFVRSNNAFSSNSCLKAKDFDKWPLAKTRYLICKEILKKSHLRYGFTIMGQPQSAEYMQIFFKVFRILGFIDVEFAFRNEIEIYIRVWVSDNMQTHSSTFNLHDPKSLDKCATYIYNQINYHSDIASDTTGPVTEVI